MTREEVGLRVGRSRVAVSNLMRLLDLPDEALELLERRQLTEGHGRALLLASDNTMRRNLARQAVAGGWSVRELEARARATDGAATGGSRVTPGNAGAPVGHPDRRRRSRTSPTPWKRRWALTSRFAPPRAATRLRSPSLQLMRRCSSRSACSTEGR